jgi:hypothetical protein
LSDHFKGLGIPPGPFSLVVRLEVMMNLRLTILPVLLGLATGGVALAQKPPPYDGPPKPPPSDYQKPPPVDQPGDERPYIQRGPDYPQARNEDLYAIQANRTGVRIRVSSNGCTKKTDFRAQVARSNPARLTFVRRTPDRCRSFAMGSVWLDFSYQELGLRVRDEFVVTNPLIAWTGPGN